MSKWQRIAMKFSKVNEMWEKKIDKNNVVVYIIYLNVKAW